jgi:hypothetical protein
MLWLGIIIGFFLGAIVSIFLISLCMSAKHGDQQISITNN